ncbi:MAG TPA: C45 family peptidase [Verrucomicrobiae bacterium]
MMKKSRLNLLWLLLLSAALVCRAQEASTKTPTEILAATLARIAAIIEPASDTEAQTFSARLEILKADGLPKQVAGQSATLAYQAPDHLVLSAEVGGKHYAMGRDQKTIWIHVPDKNFGIIGSPDVARFSTAPEKLDNTRLAPIKLPVPREQLALLALLMKVEALPAETIDEVRCQVLKAEAKPEAVQAISSIPTGQFTFWVRENDSLPARVAYSDGKKLNVEVQLHDLKFSEPWPDGKWKLPAHEGDKIETTALSHLTRFVPVLLSSFNQTIPTLGPPTGERRVVATEGKGRLEMIDGTRVLFLKGTPEEMGRQHGVLLKREIRDVVNRILYGVGVGSSFDKGRWFFGEIESAQRRIGPFIAPDYLQEMDAIASAAGIEKQEIRLANFFPELFHCSGFAVFGDATVGGKMYHGRALDYLKGVGLEQNAVVMVFQPDKGNAWVNISYAGFVGSVTAMNEKHVAIGEMGGRGEGNWDGKPMAQLVREVMEKASTLDEAVEIMRRGPRTCEYYYVISDAKSKRAVGIAATPTTFEIVKPNEAHPQLPDPVKDAVLMSAGDRYKELVKRVKEKHGKLDAESARELMTRPVCMGSNIHSVLFAPESLDFWVANADSKSPAAHCRYTKYNLADLLKSEPPVRESAAK